MIKTFCMCEKSFVCVKNIGAIASKFCATNSDVCCFSRLSGKTFVALSAGKFFSSMNFKIMLENKNNNLSLLLKI